MTDEITKAFELDQEKEKFWANVDDRYKNIMPTGILAIDRILRGVRPKQMVVFGARTRHAKTTFATQLSYHWADAGKKTLFFSNEMPAEWIIAKIASRILKIPYTDVIDGTIEQSYRDTISNLYEHLKTLPLKIYDNSEGKNVLSIAKVVHREKPDIFVLDHIQELKQEDSRQPRHLFLAEALEELRDLIKTTNSRCLLLAQCNRDTEDRKHGIPQLRDLKDSGAIEQVADTVLMGCWPFADEIQRNFEGLPMDNKYGEFDYLVQIAKNRLGSSGGCKLFFDAKESTFR